MGLVIILGIYLSILNFCFTNAGACGLSGSLVYREIGYDCIESGNDCDIGGGLGDMRHNSPPPLVDLVIHDVRITKHMTKIEKVGVKSEVSEFSSNSKLLMSPSSFCVT